MDSNILEAVSLARGEYRKNFLISKLTWMKVGGKCDFFFKPQSVEDLGLFLKNINDKNNIFVIGAGSNIIIRDGGIRGVVIKLGRNFANIDVVNDKKTNSASENGVHISSQLSGLKNATFIDVGAGCLNYNLAQFCLQNAIPGFEFLIGIPGTIGGGIAMNAGAYGKEFADIVHKVYAMDYYGNMHIFSNEEIGFHYRANMLLKKLVFIKAKLFVPNLNGCKATILRKMKDIQDKRINTQPIYSKTCGSTFTNPQNYSFKAWELVDRVGMRGFELGGAQVSTKHSNFLINKNQASASDVESLILLIQSKVREQTGIHLHKEIKIIGSDT